MDEEKKEQGKKCFIITPIGNDNSEIFRKAKGVIDSVIKPVLQRNGFDDIKPAYEIMDSGMIGNQIINRIVNDDLVVTNLTGNNPNVMYELAVRHASAKPIIHICEIGTNLPFDIKDSRTIFYTDDMLGVQELQSNFESFVKNIDYSKDYMDNPIYSGIKTGTIFKRMHDEGQQNEAEILQQILNKVSSFQRQDTVVLNSDIALKKNKKSFIKVVIELTETDREKENFKMFQNKLYTALPGVIALSINTSKIPIELIIDFEDFVEFDLKDEILALLHKFGMECDIGIKNCNFL